MIQFGDRGIIKGGFSSEVAREYFNRTAPTIYRAVNEPDGAERVRLALMVYQEAKGLWANQPPSKVKQAFLGVEGRYAKHKAEGSGSGKTPRKAEDARNGRRKKEMEKQSVKEEESVLKDAGLMPDGQEEKGGDKGKDEGKTGRGRLQAGMTGRNQPSLKATPRRTWMTETATTARCFNMGQISQNGLPKRLSVTCH